MGSMLYGFEALKKLDISNWDTKNVTNVGITSYECATPNELNLINININNIDKMNK